jgi:hypothetical protein
MTDAPQTPIAPTKGKNTIGLVALILAIVGFVLGVLPPTAAFAWLLLLPALILAIVGLTRKDAGKGTSITALILSVVGGIIAIIVAVVTALAVVGTAISDANDTPSSASTSAGSSNAPAVEEAKIGSTVTNDAGVAFTVTAITCGIPSVGESFLKENASGQFCEIKFIVDNGSDEAVDVFATDVTGFIGKAKYEANGSLSRFNDDIITTKVNPGLSANCVIYIDIPAGAALEYIKYEPLFSFDGGLIVRAS